MKKTEINSVEDYIATLPEERKKAITELRRVIKKNIPKGFKEEFSYGMIGYVVPHSVYPKGYHCNNSKPLPFLFIASQKNFIAVYHMGIYADVKLLKWFQEEYKKYSSSKLDMGKSCIRFKKPEQIPMKLIGDLASKITVNDWISTYEKNFKR